MKWHEVRQMDDDNMAKFIFLSIQARIISLQFDQIACEYKQPKADQCIIVLTILSYRPLQIQSYLLNNNIILDMNKSMIQSGPICKGNHPSKNINFCKRCAQEVEKKINNKLENVFFCTLCIPTAHQHSNKVDCFQVTHKNFADSYKDFRKEVNLKNKMIFTKYIQANTQKTMTAEEITAVMITHLKTSPPFYVCIFGNADITVADLNSMEYREWLVRSRFWQKPYNSLIDERIDEYVKNLFVPKKVDKWDNFRLEFNEQVAAINLGDEIKGSDAKLEELKREKRISDLFVQVTSCFSNEDIQRAVQESNKLEEIIPKSYNFLLKLGKLKALELHDRGAEQMRAILKSIDPSTLKQPREKQLYFYYSAIAQWIRVEDRAETKGEIFIDARNKKYFRLEDANQYVQCLTKALEISTRKQVYFAARGIGYIVMASQKKNESQAKKLLASAEDDFQKAKDSSYKSDAMDSNKLFARLRRGLEIESFILNEPLQERKTEYIMNICKHLEKTKKYIELRKCSQELVNRQPNNLGFKICLLKTLLKLKDTDAARQLLSQIKSLKVLSLAEIEEFQRKIERLKAYEQDDRGNLSDAEGKFQHAARIGQPSATHWYEYASFLFRHREERERNDKALVAINNALELKQKPEYYQLKYLLLFMMGNLEEAKQIQDHIADPKYNSMKEYVDNNN